MRFAVYGLDYDTRAAKFLAIMEAESKEEIWDSVGVMGQAAYEMAHPQIPGLVISWRGMVGVAAPEKFQQEPRRQKMISVSDSELEMAEILGKGNASEGIRLALRRAMGG